MSNESIGGVREVLEAIADGDLDFGDDKPLLASEARAFLSADEKLAALVAAVRHLRDSIFLPVEESPPRARVRFRRDGVNHVEAVLALDRLTEAGE